MNPSEISNAQSAKPALELISLATMPLEMARQNIRALLLANPDYFGKITNTAFKAVLGIQQDVTYESIGFVHYSPALRQLQVTIHMCEENGYSDDNLMCGSKEYVRFYLSIDGGVSWTGQGLGSIDVANQRGRKPQQRTLRVDADLPLAESDQDPMPVLRTILSWNVPPPEDMPEWIPLWGDVQDARLCCRQDTGAVAHDYRLKRVAAAEQRQLN